MIRLDSGTTVSTGENAIIGTGTFFIYTPATAQTWTWETDVFPEILPGTTAGSYQAGLTGTQAASPWSNGIGFYLSSANANVNDWYIHYGSTSVDCVTATAAWTRLTMVNDGANVHFYVNGTQCGTGIALASLPATSPMAMAWTSYTSTASTHMYLDVDYVAFQKTVTR